MPPVSLKRRNKKIQHQIDAVLLVTILLFLYLIFMTVVSQSIREDVTDRKPTSTAAPTISPYSDNPEVETFIFGDTVTYESRVSIATSTVADYTHPGDPQPVVAVEFAVVNFSGDRIALVDYRVEMFSDDHISESLVDIGVLNNYPPAVYVEPGQTIKWTQAWAVSNPENLQLEVTPSGGQPAAVFLLKDQGE